MGAFPILPIQPRTLPDYLPARMVNEFVYCPRLFFYEWVEGLFRHSTDTVEGAIQHGRVDKQGHRHAHAGGGRRRRENSFALGDAVERAAARDREAWTWPKAKRASSRRWITSTASRARARTGWNYGPPTACNWRSKAWCLRENGYRSEEGVAYYAKTRQRVRVVFDEALMEQTERTIAEAWRLAEFGQIPPPLVDSPKCPGCSMVGICLPDETNLLQGQGEPEARRCRSVRWIAPIKKPPEREVRHSGHDAG